jgi:hypothetical protein
MCAVRRSCGVPLLEAKRSARGNQASVGNWGFRKTLSLGRGFRVTLGKKSLGVSSGFGPFRFGVNSRNGTRSRLTIPGTGLYWEDRKPWRASRTRKSSASFAPSTASNAPTSVPAPSAAPIPQSTFFPNPQSLQQSAPARKTLLAGGLFVIAAILIYALVHLAH